MNKRLYALFTLLAVATLLSAKEYSYLDPPSITVVDFEVSMSSAKAEASKAYVGGLISQTMLTTLVQQNASDGIVVDEARYYYPPLLKIFDKRYVEEALAGGSYKPDDLYTKSIDAFAFPALDFVVLGNVYEGTYAREGKAHAGYGVNVRVLNTKRAEELYSHTGFVLEDRSNLLEVCEEISRQVLRDILNSHCAQFVVRDASGSVDTHRLFCQPARVKADDGRLVASDDSHKREIGTDGFYWVLPGEYVLTVYNETYQSTKTIPFSIATGDIKHLTIEPEHVRAETGSVTIGGVLPPDTFLFAVEERERRAAYRWEIDTALEGERQSHSVLFTNGRLFLDFGGRWQESSGGEAGVQLEYRAAANEIILTGLKLTDYDLTVTALPYWQDSEGITGLIRVPMRQVVSSDAFRLDLTKSKDARLTTDELGIREKRALDVAQKTRVTFFLTPVFLDRSVILWADDSISPIRLPLWNREKVILESEYTQAEWVSMDQVTYDLSLYGADLEGLQSVPAHYTLSKKNLDPALDTVVVVDFAEWARVEKKRLADKPATAPGVGAAAGAAVKTVTAAPARAAGSVGGGGAAQAPAAPVATRPRGYLQAATLAGYGQLDYSRTFTVSGTTTVQSQSSAGLSAGITASYMFPLSSTLSLGLGGLLVYQTAGVLGGTATASVLLGDISRSNVLLLVEAGGGWVASGRVAAVFVNKTRKGGLLLGIGAHYQRAADYDLTYNYLSYPASAYSFCATVGYLFGL